MLAEYESLATGIPGLDRFGIRGRALVYGELYQVDPKIMMGIFNNETGGKTDPPVVGDANLGGGPSIGPGQVYRTTAKALGLWTPPPETAGDIDAERAAYAELAKDEGLCVRWSIRVMKSKLEASGGDVAAAIKAYNGSGSAADSYRDKALAFLDDKFDYQTG